MEDTIINNKNKSLAVLNVALMTVYSAFHDNDEAFFNEDFGKSLLSAIESKTGMTFEILKRMYEEKNVKMCEDLKPQILSDAPNLTVKQLCDKYGCPEKYVRGLLDRNHISAKAAKKSLDEAYVIALISSWNGKYTLTDISQMTRISFKRIKELCLINSLPFKSSRKNISA